MKKKVILILLGVIVTSVLVVGFTQYPKFKLISGYSAKMMCTCTFVQHRNQQDIERTDLDFSPIRMASNVVDLDKKEVVSSVYGFAKKRAVYRPGLGCVLLKGDDDYNVSYPISNNAQSRSNTFDFVVGKTLEVNSEKLKEMDNYIFDPNLQTRASLVLHKDTLIYEKYAPNFSPETPLIGWSMTKSVISTLIGIMVKEGKMSIEEDHLFEEWENDDRSKITIFDCFI